MVWLANPERYGQMQYRYCGKSGLRLPALSLGLWHNFGHVNALESQRAILRKAFDLGITHFDLANNYGPPPGSAEENFGRLLREDFAAYRDELIISTKAGYDMWPGPYGSGGSRKYLLASLDQSLKRMGLEYVDIFYSHRVDENTPMEETASALAHAVQSGKALYVGISSYSPERTQKMVELLREWKIPLLIHQPSYNLLNRWVDKSGLLDTLQNNGVGCIAFTPLAQGLLTGKYLNGIPQDSRMHREGNKVRGLTPKMLTEANLNSLRFSIEVMYKWMTKNGVKGNFINFASATALSFMSSGCQAYPITKAGTKLVTQDMAAMAGRFGIRFNCLAPNLIWTPKQDAVYKNEKTAAYFNGLIPLGHYGMPEDAAWLMVYLASDEAKYINGCCIPVDGGWHTCH